MIHSAKAGACLLLLFVSACGADKFDVTVGSQTVVPGTPVPLAVLSQLPAFGKFADMDFSQDQTFKNQGVKKSDLDSVKLKSFTLKISAPSNADFAWLQSIRFYAEIPGKRELIAEKADIGSLGLKAPNPVLSLDVKDVELKNYVAAPSMSITAEGTGQQPPQDTTLDASVTLAVDAKVL